MNIEEQPQEELETVPDLYLESPIDHVEPKRGVEISDDERELTKIAWEVLRGEHGIGDRRKESLGDQYEEVMNEVRRIRSQNGS